MNSQKLAFKVSLSLLAVVASFSLQAPVQADSPAPTASSPTPLTGTFLQIYESAVPWYWPRNPENTKPKELLINYTELIKKLRDELAMDTIVIQNVQYSNDGSAVSGHLIPSAYEATFGDPLKDILTEAKKGTKPVKVFIGLEYNQALFTKLGQGAAVDQALVAQTSRDCGLADAIVKYTDDPARNLKFDGWYITTEIGNFDWSGDPQRTQQFAKYIHDVAEGCYKAKPLPISPYFNPQTMSADSAAKMVRDVLAGSRVNTVMVQDGVGAFNSSHNQVVDYFTALKKHLPKEIEIAADVELFTPAENVAPPSRIVDQLRWQNELGTKRVLGYEAINYLSPMPATDAKEMTNVYRVSKGDATLRATLYNEMKKLVH